VSTGDSQLEGSQDRDAPESRESDTVERLQEMAAHLREANEQLLRSALREQAWAEDVESARQALERANQELEQRVADRTAELERANSALAAEIVVRKRAEQIRGELLRQLIDAEEQERRRISRELHDQMGQQLTGLLLGLRAAEGEAEAPEMAERLRYLERLASDTARDVQSMAVELRPPALDTLGLAAAVQNHLEEWSTRHGFEHDFHARGFESVRLPAEVETTLYRVLQEALTNVVKHAGATRLGLILEQRDGSVQAIVEDNGRGFSVEEVLERKGKSQRLGVLGMRERVALMGGSMKIESAAGIGTTIYVRIPAHPSGRRKP
jgi:signal transduction histidine kinase